MLVEPDPRHSRSGERLPSVEMLPIGAHRRVGVEMLLGERIWELGVAAFQMVEIGVIGQEIEDKDLHGVSNT